MESIRVDRWLWGVRCFTTRTAATEACSAGRVRVNGAPAKPASPVHAGDRVTVRGGGRERVLEVVRVVDKRVGAAAAAACMIDHSPPAPPRERLDVPFARDPAAGRPTKRERRQLDRLRQR